MESGWETMRSRVRSSSPGTEQSSTPPKLCFDCLPAQRPDHPGMATPPLHLAGSVPFRWEEAPGKPRRGPAPTGRSPVAATAARSLDLPPRMVAQLAERTSPTTVLDGPGAPVRPPACHPLRSLSFAEARSFEMRDERRRGRKGRAAAWPWRRGRKDEGISRSRSSFSSSSSSSSSSSISLSSTHYYTNNNSNNSCCDSGCRVGGLGEEEAADSKVRITRIRRSSSLSNLSSSLHPSSPWLINFYGIIRQAIPWRKDNKV